MWFYRWQQVTAIHHLSARAQAAELFRLAQHWLLDPTATQVAERVVIDRLLRALPRSHRQAVGMRNPTTTMELMEAIERAPPFPRRVVQERRAPEGISRPISRPVAPSPRDEPMPTEVPTPPVRTWLAGCIVHQDLPFGPPEAEVKINGRPFQALLDPSPVSPPRTPNRNQNLPPYNMCARGHETRTGQTRTGHSRCLADRSGGSEGPAHSRSTRERLAWV